MWWRARVQVTDFGMAANTSNPASNALTTGAGVSHLAPERLMGSQHTPAADVFAFGAASQPQALPLPASCAVA